MSLESVIEPRLASPSPTQESTTGLGLGDDSLYASNGASKAQIAYGNELELCSTDPTLDVASVAEADQACMARDRSHMQDNVDVASYRSQDPSRSDTDVASAGIPSHMDVDVATGASHGTAKQTSVMTDGSRTTVYNGLDTASAFERRSRSNADVVHSREHLRANADVVSCPSRGPLRFDTVVETELPRSIVHGGRYEIDGRFSPTRYRRYVALPQASTIDVRRSNFFFDPSMTADPVDGADDDADECCSDSLIVNDKSLSLNEYISGFQDSLMGDIVNHLSSDTREFLCPSAVAEVLTMRTVRNRLDGLQLFGVNIAADDGSIASDASDTLSRPFANPHGGRVHLHTHSSGARKAGRSDRRPRQETPFSPQSIVQTKTKMDDGYFEDFPKCALLAKRARNRIPEVSSVSSVSTVVDASNIIASTATRYTAASDEVRLIAQLREDIKTHQPRTNDTEQCSRLLEETIRASRRTTPATMRVSRNGRLSWNPTGTTGTGSLTDLADTIRRNTPSGTEVPSTGKHSGRGTANSSRRQSGSLRARESSMVSRPKHSSLSSGSSNSDSTGSFLADLWDDGFLGNRKRTKAKNTSSQMKMLKIRLEQSSATPDPPFVYNGEADYTLYQKWVMEAKDWLRLCYIRKDYRVLRLKKYLGGRAHSFYMRDVALNARRWTLKHFLQELFDYCFPANFRTVQRERYQAFEQGRLSIRDYRRELDDLARSVGDISERNFVIQFWRGAETYLRVQWARAGYDPETSTIEELQTSGERFERASQLAMEQYSDLDDEQSSFSSDLYEPAVADGLLYLDREDIETSRVATGQQTDRGHLSHSDNDNDDHGEPAERTDISSSFLETGRTRKSKSLELTADISGEGDYRDNADQGSCSDDYDDNEHLNSRSDSYDGDRGSRTDSYDYNDDELHHNNGFDPDGDNYDERYADPYQYDYDTGSPARDVYNYDDGSNDRTLRNDCDGHVNRWGLSSLQTNMFRAQGRCFECGERGHIVRNCPEHQRINDANESENALDSAMITVSGARAGYRQTLAAAHSIGLMTVFF